jgi:hypothetical protein
MTERESPTDHVDREANPTVDGQGRTIGNEANPSHEGRVYGALARAAALQARHPEWWTLTCWPPRDA